MSLGRSLIKVIAIPYMRNPEEGRASACRAATADDVDGRDTGVGKGPACGAQLENCSHELRELVVNKLEI